MVVTQATDLVQVVEEWVQEVLIRNSRAPASGGAGAAPGNTGQFATDTSSEMVILVAVVQAQVKIMVVKPQQVEEQVVVATQDNGDKIIKQVKQVKPTQAEVGERIFRRCRWFRYCYCKNSRRQSCFFSYYRFTINSYSKWI